LLDPELEVFCSEASSRDVARSVMATTTRTTSARSGETTAESAVAVQRGRPEAGRDRGMEGLFGG
jgi:hypothetical protein